MPPVSGEQIVRIGWAGREAQSSSRSGKELLLPRTHSHPNRYACLLHLRPSYQKPEMPACQHHRGKTACIVFGARNRDGKLTMLLSDNSSESSPCSDAAAGSPFFFRLSFGVMAADTSTDDVLLELEQEPIGALPPNV